MFIWVYKTWLFTVYGQGCKDDKVAKDDILVSKFIFIMIIDKETLLLFYLCFIPNYLSYWLFCEL